MNIDKYKIPERKSHGTGKLDKSKFRKLGKNVIFEKGIWIFHPENIEIGDNVYIGHAAFLKGYYKNLMIIKSDTWIGQGCFFHSAGGIEIGRAVGIGPFVKILTSQHIEEEIDKPMLFCKQEYKKVTIGDGADIGIGAIILPGVKIGQGSIVGAGSVVTKDVKPYTVVAGVPAKILRQRSRT
ncbi:MAG: acyltransferase [Candidatus Omnitrophica bacterium]|nr:acyltransferase [Candidatus Omnitrophota bacterium]